MSLLLVGESYNLDGRSWPKWEVISRNDPVHWLEYSLRCSCYRRRCGARRAALEYCVGGAQKLDEAKCLNLLPPRECGTWDAEHADVVAEAFREWVLRPHYNRPAPVATHVLILGKRVARAVCGYDAELLSRHTLDDVKLLVFPHPSGVNRWWNDRDNWDDALCAVEELMT